ncbi:hypothetical protein B0H13DRAFT_2300541 [Mycena leptocephala]|nr:hypothetical protein B0H13DRAFT_2300541 [Mycena leptocephala]
MPGVSASERARPGNMHKARQARKVTIEEVPDEEPDIVVPRDPPAAQASDFRRVCQSRRTLHLGTTALCSFGSSCRWAAIVRISRRLRLLVNTDDGSFAHPAPPPAPVPIVPLPNTPLVPPPPPEETGNPSSSDVVVAVAVEPPPHTKRNRKSGKAKKKNPEPELAPAILVKAPKPQQQRGEKRKFHAYVDDDGKIVDSDGEPV